MFHNFIPRELLSWNALAAIGELLWFPVYFIVIYQNYKQKVCGMPLLGILAIFTQCLIYATFGPYWRPDLFPHNPVIPASFNVVWIWRGWLLVQGTVLVQFFLYHDKKYPLELHVSETELGWLIAGLLVLNIVGQWTFIVFYHDFNVNQSDPVAYLILAMGFCLLAFNRPQLQGLSYGVAWLKFFATACIFATIVARPAVSFGSMAMLASEDPVKAQRKACDIPAIVVGQTCGVPVSHCAVMDVICSVPADAAAAIALAAGGKEPTVVRTWQNIVAGTPRSLERGVCPPTEASVLAAQVALEAHGWDITGPDTVYRSDVGEFDLIRTKDPRGPVWCPQTTRWDLVDFVDGEWRFHFQFPVFFCFAGVFFDGLYIYMLWNRRRAMRQAAHASTPG